MNTIKFKNIDDDIAANPNLFEVEQPVQDVIDEVEPARTRGHLTKAEFLAICKLKSKRQAKILQENPEQSIIKVTELAFQMARDPHAQIGALRSLKGVAVPRASCLLAWVFPEKYPVIDWRGWAVLYRYGLVDRNPGGRNLQPQHWVDYLKVVREIAQRHKQTPMMIDRWLWYAADELGDIVA